LREAPNTPLGPARSLSVGARRGGRRRPAVEIGRLVRETAQCPPFLPKKERVALHREPQRSRFVLAPPFAHCRTVQLIAYLNCDGSKAGGMVGDHKLAGRGNACVTMPVNDLAVRWAQALPASFSPVKTNAALWRAPFAQ
jgi:hypothetical protein